MGHCPVTEQAVVSVIHPAVSFPALVVSVISQWMIDLQNRSKIHVLRLLWRTFWPKSEWKAVWKQLCPWFLYSRHWSSTSFSQMLKATVLFWSTLWDCHFHSRPLVQTQLCSLSSSSAESLLLSKDNFRSRREESISFIFLKEQDVQVLPP